MNSSSDGAGMARDVPSLTDWLATSAPPSHERNAAAAESSICYGDRSEQQRPLRGRAKARADAAMADAADAAERERLVREREEAQAARPARSAAEELARSLFTGGGGNEILASTSAISTPRAGGGGERERGGGPGGGGERGERGGKGLGGKGGGGAKGSSNQGGGSKGGGGKGGGGKGGGGATAAAPAAPLSRWDQMEAERAARTAADGGSRTAFAGGLAGTHGLSEAEREQRDAAQRKIKKALGTADGCAKVVADPKKLPTVKVGERWICQWEQLSMPCAHLGSEHYERNAHKVCGYCLVIGHSLLRCEMATKDGVDLAGVSAALRGGSTAPPAATADGAASGRRGGGEGKGGRGIGGAKGRGGHSR